MTVEDAERRLIEDIDHIRQAKATGGLITNDDMAELAAAAIAWREATISDDATTD